MSSDSVYSLKDGLKVLVCGPNGVGKSSLLSAVKAIYPDLWVMSGRAKLMYYMRCKNDYEVLMRMPHEELLYHFDTLVSGLLRIYARDILALDADVLNVVRCKYRDMAGPWLSLFDVFVYVDADPAIAFKRVLRDPQDLHLFSRGLTLAKKQTFYRAFSSKYKARFEDLAKAHKKPVIQVFNEGRIENVAAKLVKKLKKLSSGAS